MKAQTRVRIFEDVAKRVYVIEDTAIFPTIH